MGKMVIIYDGECRLCQGSRDWILRQSRPGFFEFTACQSAERRQRFPQITAEQCTNTILLVTPNDEIYANAEAIPIILTGMKGWHWMAYLFQFRLFKWMSPLVCKWVARHRYFLSFMVPVNQG